MQDNDFAEVFPLIWTKDVAAISDWAVATLGMTESWRAPGENGQIEHAELHWINGKVSINIDNGMEMSVTTTAGGTRLFDTPPPEYPASPRHVGVDRGAGHVSLPWVVGVGSLEPPGGSGMLRFW